MSKNICFFCGNKTKYLWNGVDLICDHCKKDKRDTFLKMGVDLNKTSFSLSALKAYFPNEYYEDWKRRHPERKLLSVQEYLVYRSKIESAKNSTGFPSPEHNHLFGTIKNVINKRNYKLIVVHDNSSPSEVVFVLKEPYSLEFISEEDINTGVTIFFIHKSSGGYLTPFVIYLDTSSILQPERISKLRRQEHRIKTYYLYPRIYKKYNYKCANCQNKKNLTIHHRNYNENNTEQQNIESMIVLCVKCHDKLTLEQKRAPHITLDKFG